MGEVAYQEVQVEKSRRRFKAASKGGGGRHVLVVEEIFVSLLCFQG